MAILFFLLCEVQSGSVCYGQETIFSYRVKPGDTVYSVAEKFGASPSTILKLNSLRPGSLVPDRVILIVRKGRPPQGTLVQDHQNTVKTFARDGKITIISVRSVALARTGGAPSLDISRGGPPLAPPIRGGEIKEESPWPEFGTPVAGVLSSRFGPRWGRFHAGIDIASPFGDQVCAAESGVVAFAGWAEGYGNLVEINHSKGFVTRYAHNSQILVQAGETVRKG
ncbi:MAG: M23 family metallopeptidase, partial [Armatimonadetes bacterium]|nr:M23 family metallopeptidase [Armatimonadota bacterium]